MTKIQLLIKLRAGILPLVIAISLIMSVICSALILALYYKNIIWVVYSNEAKAFRNIGSAKEYIMASESSSFPIGDTQAFDLFGEGNDSVFVKRLKWGAFDLFEIESTAGNYRKKECLLAGCKRGYRSNAALYLSDSEGFGLSLVGDVEINGDVFLPKQGVLPGFLEGRSFLRSKLINGVSAQSSSELPPLEKDFLDNMELLLSLTQSNSSIFKPLGDTAVYHRLFQEPLLIIGSEGSVQINSQLSGNIIVCSKTSVEINSNCTLDNVIIVAPRVIIRSNFRGRLQVFASRSIEVEDHVTLNYPSVLVCENAKDNFIHIGNNCELSGGVILASSKFLSREYGGVVKIEKSNIFGQLFSQSSIEFKGSIYGQIICRKTIYTSRNGKEYYNYLVDCRLNEIKPIEGFVYGHIIDDPSIEFELLDVL